LFGTLAAAYAASGDFDDAVKWQKKAYEVVQADSERVRGLKEMKESEELYEKHRPKRETATVIASH
jgi:hypothetical protein